MMDDTSFILFEHARSYYWRGAGLLSIKSFYGGRAHYDIGQGAFLVDDRSYLVLNHGQAYTISIESNTEVTSLCVFFAPGLAHDVRRTLTASPEVLLDDPVGEMAPTTPFFQRTYRHDRWLSPILEGLRTSYPLHHREPGWLDEQLNLLMERLLQVHRQACRDAETLPAARRATREEQYRRLHLARDFIAASYDQPIRLDDMARVACLSPNHLIRTFKQAFGQTPHQYLTRERLRQARRLLVTTEQPVTDICLAVGFESLGSFSWLFRRRFGLSPQAYRRRNG